MAMHEIIWHGRGGQGVVLAAQILAESAYIQGFPGVTSAPTFGPERRGAPLTASTRISDGPIRTFSQIASADIAVILDESLLEAATGAGRIKKKGSGHCQHVPYAGADRGKRGLLSGNNRRRRNSKRTTSEHERCPRCEYPPSRGALQGIWPCYS